jgi:uncharacterized protein (DUF2141 family)
MNNQLLHKEKQAMRLSLILIFWIINPIFTLSAQNSQDKVKLDGNIRVIVEGLENDKGFVQIGLFNSKESWEGKIEKLRGAIIPLKSTTMEWNIENIPFGEYAVKLFHDENGDNKLNTNFLGMPVEDYGFSNNPTVLFGPPSFEKVKFVFSSQDTSITIKLR